jgi:hypothetical protein
MSSTRLKIGDVLQFDLDGSWGYVQFSAVKAARHAPNYRSTGSVGSNGVTGLA